MKSNKKTSENTELTWMPLYVDKMLSGTSHMDAAELGGYLRLLLEQFKKGFVPGDIKLLKKLSGLPDSKLQLVLLKFKKLEDGTLQNAYCAEVRTVQHAKYFNNIEKSSKGGIAKRDKYKTSVPEAPSGQHAGTGNQLPDECPEGADNRIKNIEIRNKGCVQELRTKSVDSEKWLAETQAATAIPTHTLITFCNTWIQNAGLRRLFDDFPPNKILSMMLEDLQKEKPKLLPPPPLKIIDHLDMWVRK